jgi:hypothetical protein
LWDNTLGGEDHDDQLSDEEDERGGVIGSMTDLLHHHEADSRNSDECSWTTWKFTAYDMNGVKKG